MVGRFWTEFGCVFDAISKDPTVRAVVLASALPKIFSAGIDCKLCIIFRLACSSICYLHAVQGLATTAQGTETDPARKALQLWKDISRFQHAISATERCPYPVIAAVHGIAYGLAIDILSACDIRYAAENVRFSIKVDIFALLYCAEILKDSQEVDVGLAADIGTLARLPRITGNQSIVNELALTARDFGAEEAQRMGFVSKVVPGSRDEVVRAALETATVIAQKSPIAVLGTKKVLQHSRDHS
jgi:Delta3,5-Delta2,4-dienoyl-CoA isomerase